MGTPAPAPAPGAAGRAGDAGAFDAGMFPSGHRPWRKWVIDHNPCLLLSTLLMLVGCGLANLALQEASDNLQILALLGAINLYEACIIPLGLVMIRRSRGTARDGWWLMMIEVLFLVNVPLANSKMGPGWMIPLEVGLWLLACVKAAIILRGLKIGLGMRTFGFLALQLGVIYSLPIVFAIAAQNTATMDRVVYGILWVLGLLPVAYDVVARVQGRDEPWDRVQNIVRRVYIIAPWCGLALHILFWRQTLWYRISLADLGPALLGLAAMSRRLNLRPDWRMAMRFVPAATLLLTLLLPGQSVPWVVQIGDVTKEVTAAHWMFAATLLTYGYMGTMWQLAAAAGTVTALGLAYLFIGWILQGTRAGVRVAGNLMPTSIWGWAVTTMGMAFLLLGIGAYLGLRRIGKEAQG